MAELNAADENDPQPENGPQPVRRRGLLFRMGGWLALAAFIFLLIAAFLEGDRLPPHQVLTRSNQMKETRAVSAWQQGVVLIEAADSRGTGFNIDPDGLVVTNAHVVDEADQVWVKFSQGLIYRGTVEARFPQTDLALIRIPGSSLPWLQLADSAPPAVGSSLLIIGNPLGFPFVTTQGTAGGETVLAGWKEPVLRILTYVEHGSSGSPVLNSQGQVVGIVFAMADGSHEGDSWVTTAFAVTVDSLQRCLTAADLK